MVIRVRSPIADRLERHYAVGRSQVAHRIAVLIGETVVELEAVRGLDVGDPPPAAALLTLGPRHVVVDLAAGHELVLLEGRRPGGRAPPALQLARVFPDLPYPLDGGVELGDEGEAERLGILD
jgi:hypothetical protein